MEHIIDITSADASSSVSGVESRYSTSGCAIFWTSMELVVNLVLIVTAVVVSTLAKDEHPQALLLAWLIAYTFGCITDFLLTLSYVFQEYKRTGEYSRTRMLVLDFGNSCFFVVWLVLGIVWIRNGHFSASDHAPKLYRLCIFFIVASFIRIAVSVCCLFWRFTVQESLERSTSSELDLVDILRSIHADSVVEGLGGGSPVPIPSPDDCCSICLGKYGEGRTRRLECSHIFHLKCIDNWLRIKPTCPLCQSHVRGMIMSSG